MVADIDENLSEGEIMPDGISGGVDFANMMKYNRSFIARIIIGVPCIDLLSDTST